jgi:hypothetical protein
VAVREDYASGRVGEDALNAALEAAGQALEEVRAATPSAAVLGSDRRPEFAPVWAAGAVVDDIWAAVALSAAHAEACARADAEGDRVTFLRALAEEADLLRDIVGNPFRPVAFSSEWRTSNAVGLAEQMYESRDFGAMPILADALQEAGCEVAEVLSHCRGPGPHVRG